jgi:hypothetical protein
MFAARLRIIAAIAGWSWGTSGKRRRIKGRSPLAIDRIIPPSRTMPKNPSHNAIWPTSSRANRTAPLAASRDAVVTWGILPVKAAVRTEPTMRKKKRPLSTWGRP